MEQPGLPNEPQGPEYDPNAPPSGQGRRSRTSRKRKLSRRRGARRLSRRRRGGVQDPEREEGEIVGPRLPAPAAPPAASTPGLPNEPQGPGYDPNAPPSGQGRRSRRRAASRRR